MPWLTKWLKAKNYNLSLYKTIFIKDNRIFETPFDTPLGIGDEGIEKYFNLYDQNIAQGLISNDLVVKCNLCNLKYVCESFSPVKKVSNYQYEKQVYCNFTF